MVASSVPSFEDLNASPISILIELMICHRIGATRCYMNRRRGCHLGMYDIQLHSELGMMTLLSSDTLLDLY